MKTGKGYWVKAELNNLELQIQGQEIVEELRSISVNSDWDLIGFKIAAPITVEEAIMKIDKGVTSIWGYHMDKWLLYDPDNPAISDLEVVEPGRGYWILVDSQ